MTGHPVAILPSLDEPDTIAGVVTAVDTALDDEHALIVHADASVATGTAIAFQATAIRARTLCLTGLPPGKGGQVRAALRHVAPAGPVLLADTDTRNPHPSTYRALLDRVASGAGIALADYQRYWDEANLTNHLARPLIAAATGHDVPQPLAGDIALAPSVAAAVDAAHAALPGALAAIVDGYGIDAFLLQVAVATGMPVVTVHLAITKQHAPSFPHLPTIFAEAVPVLLHPAATLPARTVSIGQFRLTDRPVPAVRLDTMLGTLRRLRPDHSRYDDLRWDQAVAASWRAVAEGIPALTAADWLWPAYLDHVHTWLTNGATTTVAQRATTLQTTATTLLDTLAADRKDRP